MRDEKAIWDEDARGDVFKLLGEDGLKATTQLINNVGCMKLESGPEISLNLQ